MVVAVAAVTEAAASEVVVSEEVEREAVGLAQEAKRATEASSDRWEGRVAVLVQ